MRPPPRLIPMLALAALAALCVRAARAADAQLTLPDFASLEAKASETVNVTLDASLIGLAGRFLDPSKPEDAAVRKLINGLQGIYVRSYTFDSDFAYPKAEVDRVRSQLSAPGWRSVVQVHDVRKHNDVDIYMYVDRNRVNGLAIIASQPREFTIVNIVGSVDLEQLHELEGRFGIPKLQLQNKP
jgi:hypothetical protein